MAHGGVAARIIAYGATLQSLVAPNSSGALADVVLGYPDLESYVTKRRVSRLHHRASREPDCARAFHPRRPLLFDLSQ